MLCEKKFCLIEAKLYSLMWRSHHENAYHQNETLLTVLDLYSSVSALFYESSYSPARIDLFSTLINHLKDFHFMNSSWPSRSPEVKGYSTKWKSHFDFLSNGNTKCMCISYRFKDISHSAIWWLSNLSNYYCLITFKFNRLLSLTIPS